MIQSKRRLSSSSLLLLIGLIFINNECYSFIVVTGRRRRQQQQQQQQQKLLLTSTIITTFPTTTTITTTTCLYETKEQRQEQQQQQRTDIISNDNVVDDDIILFNNEIQSPVLKLLYPKMIEYKKQYGHVNIPLGTKEGKQCNTLRRLHIQDKLCESDIEILNKLNFTWYSLEDVYEKQKEHFNDFLQRLIQYGIEHDGDISPPKKLKSDPELGAWVTALRRLRNTEGIVDVNHIQQLDEINFQWTSARKCGSKFMIQYRDIIERLNNNNNNNIEELLDNDPKIKSWLKAQQTKMNSSNNEPLSQTRQHYMEQLFGINWKEL